MPLDEPEQERGAELVLDQARQARRGSGRTGRSRARARARPCRPTSRARSPVLVLLRPSSGGSCALAETSSARKPIASEPPSATTPRMIGRRRTRWRRIAESSGKVLTSISPSAASSGESRPRAAARRSACAPRPPSGRRRASSRPRARPGRRRARRAAAFSSPCSPTSANAPASAAGRSRGERPRGRARASLAAARRRGRPICGESAARRAAMRATWRTGLGPSAGDPWRRGAGSARRVRRCPSASAGPCRTGGSSSRPRRAASRASSGS